MEHANLEHLAACPICGAPPTLLGSPIRDYSISQELFHLVDCASCGFRFTNPRPYQGGLEKYYNSPSYISHSNTKTSLQDKLYHIARRIGLRQKFNLIKAQQPFGRVLDVGCGTGEFLSYLLGRGYLVSGVEPNLHAREQAIANYSISVVPALEQVAGTENFQVVTLWHVLEHVPDLRATFKRLFALLADHGLLVIAVPDRESWDASYYRDQWAAWDVPRHFSHFRKKDVERLLHEHGFELITVRRMWIDALYISMLSEAYRGTSKPVALLKGALIGSWSNLVSAFTGRPTSSSLFIARKGKP